MTWRMRGALVLLLLLAVSVPGQAYFTDTVSHEPPTTGQFAYDTWNPTDASFPAAGSTYTDPVFGETIRRLTNEYPNQSWTDIYSRNGFWNADGTRFLHGYGQGTVGIYNTTTGARTHSAVPFGNGRCDISFDPVDANVYYFFSGLTLRQFNLTTSTASDVKTFPAALGALGCSLDYIDRTGRYFVLDIGGAIRVWDKTSDVLYTGSITELTIGNGYATITPNGSHVVIVNGADHRSYEINHSTQTVVTTGVQYWSSCTDHADIISASDGKSYEVGQNCSTATADIYRIDITKNQAGRSTSLQIADNLKLLDADQGGFPVTPHMSCVTKGGLQDWCFIDLEDNNDIFNSVVAGNWFAYRSEIVGVNVLTGEIRRLVHHRSRCAGCTNLYYAQPKLSTMWDGTKIAYQSNHNVNATSGGYADIYIIELNWLAGSSTPTITTLSPSTASAGGAAFTLTVNGTNFSANSTVQVGGSNRTTTFVSSSQLTASILAADIATAGTLNITVSDPEDGDSSATTLTVQAARDVPVLSAITPTGILSGSPAFHVRAQGSLFHANSVIRVQGVSLHTTYHSAAFLHATIGASHIAIAGDKQVDVFTSAPGGGTSSHIGLVVDNPVPVALSVSPLTAVVGATPTLSIVGTHFAASAEVRFEGLTRTTTRTSATHVSATLLAADTHTAGTTNVRVFNPPPGGGTSSALTFTVTNPIPVLTSMSPSSTASGGPDFTLTVTGSSFRPTSTVRWGGADRSTTYISATQLSAIITSSDISGAGTTAVTVFNPTPGGGTSQSLTFTSAASASVPTLSSISPTSATAGGADFTLTATGTDFTTLSVVRINGSERVTVYGSGTSLTATILSSDIAGAGTATITVFTPAPGGGTSGGQTLTITAPAASAGVNFATSRISWSAVQGAVYYRVKCGTSPGVYNSIRHVLAPNTSVFVSEVVPATSVTYYCAISSVNTFGESPNSTEVNFLPDPTKLVPGTPAAPTVQ